MLKLSKLPLGVLTLGAALTLGGCRTTIDDEIALETSDVRTEALGALKSEEEIITRDSGVGTVENKTELTIAERAKIIEDYIASLGNIGPFKLDFSKKTQGHLYAEEVNGITIPHYDNTLLEVPVTHGNDLLGYAVFNIATSDPNGYRIGNVEGKGELTEPITLLIQNDLHGPSAQSSQAVLTMNAEDDKYALRVAISEEVWRHHIEDLMGVGNDGGANKFRPTSDGMLEFRGYEFLDILVKDTSGNYVGHLDFDVARAKIIFVQGYMEEATERKPAELLTLAECKAKFFELYR